MLRPIGPLIAADAAQFRQRMMEVRRVSLGRLVLDVSAVPYADSRGLEAMLDVHDELIKAGQSLKLCSVNDTLREVLTLTELYQQFEHFEDPGSAVRSFL
ncbi:MAG: STAS domain-containing protein [Phycisphaeraceae bacterium]|nr:STAS domain-containing protein [Phycisphaeraceae bacterium]